MAFTCNPGYSEGSCRWVSEIQSHSQLHSELEVSLSYMRPFVKVNKHKKIHYRVNIRKLKRSHSYPNKRLLPKMYTSTPSAHQMSHGMLFLCSAHIPALSL